ncbi:MAG: Rieske 2Fe-2S domain-containing protein, partial [Candidatus Ventricola sp.]
ERTWDCACHGSRFSETGKLLDNPALGDLPTAPPQKKDMPQA